MIFFKAVQVFARTVVSGKNFGGAVGGSKVCIDLSVKAASVGIMITRCIGSRVGVVKIKGRVSGNLDHNIVISVSRAIRSVHDTIDRTREGTGVRVSGIVMNVPDGRVDVRPYRKVCTITDRGGRVASGSIRGIFTTTGIHSIPPRERVVSIVPRRFVMSKFSNVESPENVVNMHLRLCTDVVANPGAVVRGVGHYMRGTNLRVRSVIMRPLTVSDMTVGGNRQSFKAVLVSVNNNRADTSIVRSSRLGFTFISPRNNSLIAGSVSVVLGAALRGTRHMGHRCKCTVSRSASSRRFFPIRAVNGRRPMGISRECLSRVVRTHFMRVFRGVGHTLSGIRTHSLPNNVVLAKNTTTLPNIISLTGRVFRVGIGLCVPRRVKVHGPVCTADVNLVGCMTKLSSVCHITGKGMRTANGIVPLRSGAIGRPTIVRRPICRARACTSRRGCRRDLIKGLGH